jgi:4-hydroxy-3-polyprenylbenzoate decarboxylase
VHAVDAAGVHPLLLAIGSERYTPYEPRRTPRELLTQANAILGQGQLSLAKYLLIAAREDDPDLDLYDIPAFLRHMLERLDLRRDLHFQTRTTIDTLDYSGEALHHGSKVVLAAVGPPIRKLAGSLPEELRLPPGFGDPQVVLPGILAVRGPCWPGPEDPLLAEIDAGEGFPLVVVVEDSLFVARSLANFLWVTFTRSSPAPDLGGRGARVINKHWGCAGPLVLDARPKPHHARILEDDPRAVRRVEALAAPGGPLHGIF